jgi:hypothetical protein
MECRERERPRLHSDEKKTGARAKMASSAAPTPPEGGVLRATLLGHQIRLFKAAVTFLSKLGEQGRNGRGN